MRQKKMLKEEILEQYQALIFDMDGTLIDTMSSHALAWEKAGKVLGYDVKGDVMYQLGGATSFTIAKAIMEQYQVPEHYLEQFVQIKREIATQMILENATLLPAFDIVKNQFGKKPMALGTGSHRKLVELLFNRFQLTPYFQVVVDSEDVTKHKPDPETFLRCAEKLGVKPEHCLVFEDADLGVQAALAGGMDVFDVRTQKITKVGSI